MPKRSRKEIVNGGSDVKMSHNCNNSNCGHRTIVRDVRRRLVPERVKLFTVNPRYRGKFTTVRIPSAYYGDLNVPCYDYGNGNVALIARVPGMAGQPELTVMAVDGTKNRLDPLNNQYTLQRLVKLPPSEVNVALCRYYANVIAGLRAKPVLSAMDQYLLRLAIAYVNVVDIHFATCNDMQLLHEEVGINNVSNTNVVVSIHNIPNLDNAFFTGKFMVYGNGASMFNPLGSIDIAGHELGHGAVAMLTGDAAHPDGMVYQGHPGAINESFADVFGTMLEFWTAAKYNQNADLSDDIKVTPDYLIGEDIAADPLRNMANPTSAKYPQPDTYRGPFWVNPVPKTPESDFGGVHSNSGVGNCCFYRYANLVGLRAAFQTYVNALKTLGSSPSYLVYRDKLIAAATAQGTQLSMTSALNSVGLGPTAVSDWTP